MCLLRNRLTRGKKARCDNFWPMVNKLFASPEAALADIPDGSTIMIGGFGNAGMPAELIDALIAQGAGELTIVNNNAGNADTGLAALLKAKSARNFGPIMASAARCAVVQVRETVELGALDPESIVTPGIFVKRVVRVAPSMRKAA